MTAWSDYQEETAEFFRKIGFEAETNVTVQGARTSHDIDVLVKSRHLGFDVVWLVECKRWKSRVSKLHVLALREIVADLGADRGILLSESGFQRGAREAAQLTNVQLRSLAELEETATHEIGLARLREIQDRVDSCRTRYWNIDKETRIERGLRADVGQAGYSGQFAIRAAQAGLDFAFRGALPIDVDRLESIDYLGARYYGFGLEEVQTPLEMAEKLELLVSDLERRLEAAEADPETDTGGSN